MTRERTLFLVPLKYLIPLCIGIGLLYVLIIFFWPRLAIALALGTLGFSMVWKTVWWLDMFGRNAWAEKFLTSGLGAGSGGSWLFYKLLGIVIIVSAFLYLTNLLQLILVNVLGVFFGGNQNF